MVLNSAIFLTLILKDTATSGVTITHFDKDQTFIKITRLGWHPLIIGDNWWKASFFFLFRYNLFDFFYCVCGTTGGRGLKCNILKDLLPFRSCCLCFIVRELLQESFKIFQISLILLWINKIEGLFEVGFFIRENLSWPKNEYHFQNGLCNIW